MKNLTLKLFIIFAIFFVFVFSLSICSFADNEEISYLDFNNVTRSFTLSKTITNFKYVLFTYKNMNNTTAVTIYMTDFEFYFNENDNCFYSLDNESHDVYYLSDMLATDQQNINFQNKINTYPIDKFLRSSWDCISGSSTSDGLVNVVYSNYNIKNKDGNVVFQAAPQEGELTTIAKSIDFSTVLAEILGILPMTLLVLIGILSLMKAIKLLLQTLRKA